MQFNSRYARCVTLGLGLWLTACGGGDDDKDKAAPTDKFVGVWKYTSGTMTYNCDGDTTTENVSGNETVSKGSTSDLIITDEDCAYKFDVSGSVASAAAGQNCTVTGTITVVSTVSSLVFTTSDGALAHVSGTFNVVLSSGGDSQTCTATLTGDLQKL